MDGEARGCQVRVGEPCRLCVPGATGPDDCGLAYLVASDPDLREQLIAMWERAQPEAGPAATGASPADGRGRD